MCVILHCMEKNFGALSARDERNVLEYIHAFMDFVVLASVLMLPQYTRTQHVIVHTLNMSTEVVSIPVTLHEKPPIAPDPTDDLDDEDVRSNDDDDDAGSLVDFIVEEEGEDGDEDDDASVTSEPPKTEEEERARDLDGIDTSNIITGKRTRRQTTFYEQEVFNTDEYRKMILDDVPEDERHALEESSDEEEDDESEEDGEYEDSEDKEEGGEEEEKKEPPPTPMKKQKS